MKESLKISYNFVFPKLPNMYINNGMIRKGGNDKERKKLYYLYQKKGIIISMVVFIMKTIV